MRAVKPRSSCATPPRGSSWKRCRVMCITAASPPRRQDVERDVRTRAGCTNVLYSTGGSHDVSLPSQAPLYIAPGQSSPCSTHASVYRQARLSLPLVQEYPVHGFLQETAPCRIVHQETPTWKRIGIPQVVLCSIVLEQGARQLVSLRSVYTVQL